MQSVGVPRFYVDLGQYLLAIGYDFGYEVNDDERHLMSLNPTKQIELYSGWQHVRVPRVAPITYAFFLGHNAAYYQYPKWFDVTDGVYEAGIGTGIVTGINESTESVNTTPEHTGFSLWTFIDIEDKDYCFGIMGVGNGNKVGAISMGNYYDMPHSPDLNLKMSIEMDGVKNIKTKGGASLSNISYTKPQDWGDMGAWQLGGASNLRSGRRVWDLSFSYLSDTDVFPVNATTSNPLNTYPADDTLLDGTDFFSQVWNRTMGGHLPFIFQPDGSNNNPDQFSICRFDMNSLTYDQVANNAYNVKLKIRESW